MRFLLGLIVILSVVALPGEAQAQRRGGRGQMMTVDGPVMNFTYTPEWRQAGGNYGKYLQIMEQKAMVAQQKATDKEYKEYQKQFQAAQKQQAAFEKWVKDQKAKKAKGKPVDPAFQQMLDEEARYKAAEEARAAKAAAKKAKKKPKAAVPAVEKAAEPVVEKAAEPPK